jgi:hypothetical protein
MSHAWSATRRARYAADVWVNGKQIATRTTVQGAYTQYTFDVSQLIRPGTVLPPETGDQTAVKHSSQACGAAPPHPARAGQYTSRA